MKGNEGLMRETEQSVGVKCPTVADEDSEKDSKCRKAAQNFGTNSGIATSLTENNYNSPETKTLTHSGESHAKTKEECQKNNVNVSGIKSSNCLVDGGKNECEKDECKQSVSVNKESDATKYNPLHNWNGGSSITEKCSTDSSQNRSGGHESNKAERSSGAGKDSPKEKGCSKNNGSSGNISKIKGLRKGSMKDFSQETNSNDDSIKTSIAREAKHGFPKADGTMSGEAQRNMATEKHCVTTSGAEGSQKQNQNDVNTKNLKGASNSHSKSKTKDIKSCLKNHGNIGKKSRSNCSMTSDNGRDLSDGRKAAEDAVPSTKISPPNSDCTKNSTTRKKCSQDNQYGSLGSCRIKQRKRLDQFHWRPISLSPNRSFARVQPPKYGEGKKLCRKISDEPRLSVSRNSSKDSPQRSNGVKRKRTVASETTSLVVAPSKKTCLENRKLENKGNDNTTKLVVAPPKTGCSDLMGRENVIVTTSEVTSLVLTPSSKTSLGTKSVKRTHKSVSKKAVGCRDLRDLSNKKKNVISPEKKLSTGGNQKSVRANNNAENKFIEAKGQAVEKTFGQLKNSDTNNYASMEKKAEERGTTISNTSTENIIVKTSDATNSDAIQLTGNALKISKSMQSINRPEGKGLNATKKCLNCYEQENVVQKKAGIDKPSLINSKDGARKQRTCGSGQIQGKNFDQEGKYLKGDYEEIPVSKRSEKESLKKDLTNIKTVSENQQQATTMRRPVSAGKSIGVINKSILAKLKSLRSKVQKRIKIPEGDGDNSHNVGHGNAESVQITDKSRSFACKRKTIVSEGAKQALLPKDGRIPAVKNAKNQSVTEKLFVTPKDSKCSESNSVQVREIKKSADANNTLDLEISNCLTKRIHEAVSFSTENRTRLQDTETVDSEAVTHRNIAEKVSQEHKDSELQPQSIASYVVNRKHVELLDVVSGSRESSAPNVVDVIDRSTISESLAIEELEGIEIGETFTGDNSNPTSTENVSEVKQQTLLQNDQILAKDNSSYLAGNYVSNSPTTKIGTAQLSESLALTTVARNDSDIREMKKVRIEKTSPEKKLEEENFKQLNTNCIKSFDKAAPSFSSDILQVIKSTIGGTLSEDKKGYAIKTQLDFPETEDVPVSQSIVCCQPCSTEKTSVSSQKIIESSGSFSVIEDITSKAMSHTVEKEVGHFGANSPEIKEQLSPEKVLHQSSDDSNTQASLKMGLIERNPIPVLEETELDRGACTSGNHEHLIQGVALSAEKFGVHGSNGNLVKSVLTEKSPIPLMGEPGLVMNSGKNTRDTLARGNIARNGMLPNFGASEGYPAPISSGSSRQQNCNQNYIPSWQLINAKSNTQINSREKKNGCRLKEGKNKRKTRLRKMKSLKKGTDSNVQSKKNNSTVRQLNETNCEAGGLKQANTYESQSTTKDALKKVFQTVFYGRNSGENSVENRQEISAKKINEKTEKLQASTSATCCQNSKAGSNDTKFNAHKSQPAPIYSTKCSQEECFKDPNSFENSVRCEKGFIQSSRGTTLNYLVEGTQEVLNPASQADHGDENNGGTLLGVCHEDNDGLTEDFAISGKRKQEEKKAEWESNKRQKCEKLMENVGSHQAVDKNVKLSEKEQRRQQRESIFLWRNIKAIEVVSSKNYSSNRNSC